MFVKLYYYQGNDLIAVATSCIIIVDVMASHSIKIVNPWTHNAEVPMG